MAGDAVYPESDNFGKEIRAVFFIIPARFTHDFLVTRAGVDNRDHRGIFKEILRTFFLGKCCQIIVQTKFYLIPLACHCVPV